jgi:MoxR-like ATPase
VDVATDYRPGKDTRPLAPSELAASEIQSLKKIERRIKEVQRVAKKARQEREGRPPLIYLAYADVRYQRVLLLDGDRGTGKTSLLVTLARRWNPP